MSILIKGMKIPKNCIQCEWHEEYGGDYDWCHACRLTGSMPIDNAETGRADDCPLETYEPCTDTISRQAAIDAAIEAADDWDGGYNLTRGNMIEEAIKKLPSAQPEIVRCKDCKWKQGSECVRFAEVRPFPDDFCSRAERRTDERMYDVP